MIIKGFSHPRTKAVHGLESQPVILWLLPCKIITELIMKSLHPLPDIEALCALAQAIAADLNLYAARFARRATGSGKERCANAL